MNQLSGALFNFCLPPARALIATASVMAACNRRPAVSGYDPYGNLVCPALPDDYMPLAAAAAVVMLHDRGEAVTDSFRRLASGWFRRYGNLAESAKEQVIATIKIAWPGHLEAQSPLRGPLISAGFDMGFHDIVRGMQENLPKLIDTPRE